MKFKTLTQYCLPQHTLSRLIGGLAKCRWPWLKNLLINWFIKQYQIDLAIAAEPNPKEYATFNDFFTRALKPEARPIAKEENAIICPNDGHISQIGKIADDQIIQAKGHKFSLKTLLSHSSEAFKNGSFATLYLSPQDYHRIHMPIAGTLTKMTHVPGKLFSVQPQIIDTIPNLYARNERVVNIFSTKIGPVAVILVGAILVASIETVWAGEITPPGRKKVRHFDYADKKISLDRGKELGRFQFGSTVILLFPENSIKWQKQLQPNTKVTMGQKLGEVL